MGAKTIQYSCVKEGAFAVFPLAFGVLPIGMIFGASAIQGGMSTLQTVGSSLFMAAGSAQILAVSLIKENTATAVIILSAFMINLRHIIYSARLSELAKDHPKRTLGVLSYFLTDECFVTLNEKLSKNEKISPGYFFGAGLTLWLLWQISTYAGIYLGGKLPTWLHIQYFADFIFLAIICQAVRSKEAAVGVCTGFFLSAALVTLPYKLNILFASAIASYFATRLKK